MLAFLSGQADPRLCHGRAHPATPRCVLPCARQQPMPGNARLYRLQQRHGEHADPSQNAPPPYPTPI